MAAPSASVEVVLAVTWCFVALFVWMLLHEKLYPNATWLNLGLPPLLGIPEPFCPPSPASEEPETQPEGKAVPPPLEACEPVSSFAILCGKGDVQRIEEQLQDNFPEV